jgi:hypothetical protein
MQMFYPLLNIYKKKRKINTENAVFCFFFLLFIFSTCVKKEKKKEKKEKKKENEFK